MTTSPASVYKAVINMERYGGGFCAALAQAWYKADSQNKRIIEEAFSHLFVKYEAY
jgi:hypothetical protein